MERIRRNAVILFSGMLVLIFFPQELDAGENRISVGISRSDIEISSFSAMPGVLIGMKNEWKISGNFCLESEINLHYMQKKFKNKLVWSYPGVLSAYDLSVKMFFYEIPLLAKFYIPGSDSKIALLAGPSLQLCLAGTVGRSLVRVIDDSYAFGFSNQVPDYEVSFIEDPGPVFPLIDNSSFGFNLGAQSRMFGHLTEIRYNISKMRSLDAVTFDKPLHTFSFIISF